MPESRPSKGSDPLSAVFEGHLYLVGLPGAGKTTCARLLGARLHRPAIDLDDEIAQHAGIGVPEIFERFGEAHFRALEHDATLRVVGRLAAVVAPGGGWVENPANLAVARRSGRVVYLEVSPARALARLGDDVGLRPLLRKPDPGGAIEALLARRAPLYATADARINTEDFNPQQVTELLLELALRWGTPVG